jgi:hypothetical protein
MDFTLDMMAGPTDQARVLQLAQCVLADKFYEALRSVEKGLTHEERYRAPAVVAARDTYEASVTELVALLGPNAECHQVDCDLWECFHNIYKDDVGCRPRAGWSLQGVKAYLERRRVEDAHRDANAAAIPA